MKNHRRHISAAFFGSILLLPLLAIGFLQLGQAYIKSTRDERLEKEKLVQVILPAKDVVWEEEGKELWVGDKMFDVASYKLVDGNYHLSGVYDDDETEVAGSVLHTLLSQNGNGLLKLLLLLQCFSASLILPQLVRYWSFSSRHLTFYHTRLLSAPHLVLGPPPRQ